MKYGDKNMYDNITTARQHRQKRVCTQYLVCHVILVNTTHHLKQFWISTLSFYFTSAKGVIFILTFKFDYKWKYLKKIILAFSVYKQITLLKIFS